MRRAVFVLCVVVGPGAHGTSWQAIITPENGIVRVEPLVETTEERAGYLVCVNGSGVLRATVVPFDDRYVLAGWTTC
jgi:hypothetical protein